MSQNNSNDKAAMLAKIEGINKVDGFDPTPFAVDYTDLETGEVRKRLPVMIQMAWFRMKYPEGRIAVTVSERIALWQQPRYTQATRTVRNAILPRQQPLADIWQINLLFRPANGHRRQPSVLPCVTPALVCSLLWQVMNLKILPRMN